MISPMRRFSLVSSVLMAVHGVAARRRGKGWRILSSLLRIATMKLEQAPQRLIDREIDELKRRLR